MFLYFTGEMFIHDWAVCAVLRQWNITNSNPKKITSRIWIWRHT